MSEKISLDSSVKNNKKQAIIRVCLCFQLDSR